MKRKKNSHSSTKTAKKTINRKAPHEAEFSYALTNNQELRKERSEGLKRAKNGWELLSGKAPFQG